MEIQQFPATTQAPDSLFTGDVWFDVVAAPPAPGRLRANTVRFAPGARTHWHVHPGGQSLHVTQGVARIGTRDSVIEARPGQTVWCPPGEWHWHGAGPDSFMEHLALWEVIDGQDAEWGDPVTAEEYDA